MLRKIIIVFIVALNTITNSSLAKTNSFAFVNKSFSRDLKVSIRLYESYEKFATPAAYPFYIVVPQIELNLFQQAFLKAKESHSLKTAPHFITDEEVLNSCGPHIHAKTVKMNGWMQQQVIKMCFYKMNLANNYLTIDSDTYFTKTFPIEELFENGLAKTYAPNKLRVNNKDEFSRKSPELLIPFSKIKDVLGDTSTDYNNFVSGFAMWSSDLLDQLNNFTLIKYNYDFADLINISPYEMQWYGNFVFTKKKDLFLPLEGIFAVIGKENAQLNKKECIPTSGYPWQYGISYQHSEETYVNPCGKVKTIAKIGSKKISRYSNYIKQKLANIINNL